MTDISQLTYLQFYELIFTDISNRIEWHENNNNLEAQAWVSKRNDDKCISDCGNKVYYKNVHTNRMIHIIVKTSFSVPNMLPYIANHYKLAPGEEVLVACDLLCYNDDSFDLDHQIVVAEFIE